MSLDGVYMSNVVWKGDDAKDADMAEEEDATGSQADRARDCCGDDPGIARMGPYP